MLGLAACLTLPACALLPEPLQKFGKQLETEWKALLKVIRGDQSPLAGKKPGQGAGEDEPLQGEAAQRARENAELLREMFLVIFLEEPENRQSFGSYVDSLNQGASLEGMYNGFTHSNFYRRLEVMHRGASPAALTAFCRELVVIEGLLSKPTEFTEKSALPLPVLGQDAGTEAGAGSPGAGSSGAGENSGGSGVTTVIFGAASAESGEKAQDGSVKPDAAGGSAGSDAASESKAPGESAPTSDSAATDLSAKCSTLFQSASIFTLKRILADEVLKVIYEKKADHKGLAEWYSSWAVSLRSHGVDFGLEQRNSSDASFHAKWAETASEDRIVWESLNRVHRLLNQLHRGELEHRAGGAG